jgi:adenylate kinase
MRLVLLGAPGVGKGTQAARVAAAWGVPHISTGGMLREEGASGTELGRRVKPLIERGDLAPDDVIAEVVAARLRRDDARAGFLLDGFPRTARQVELLDRILEGSPGLDCAVLLEAAEDVLVQRLLGRAVKGDCGRRRADDTLETIRRRIALFREETAPVATMYERRGILARVDGAGTVDEVFDRIAAVLEGAVR